jgi:hypothetical protein
MKTLNSSLLEIMLLFIGQNFDNIGHSNENKGYHNPSVVIREVNSFRYLKQKPAMTNHELLTPGTHKQHYEFQIGPYAYVR